VVPFYLAILAGFCREVKALRQVCAEQEGTEFATESQLVGTVSLSGQVLLRQPGAFRKKGEWPMGFITA
jgi:hypothetical protein